jgi:DUF2075 family protein
MNITLNYDSQGKQTSILSYLFSKDSIEKIKRDKKGIDWPTVYLLLKTSSPKFAYVGETLSAYDRMEQHLKNPEKQKMEEIRLLVNDTFNKSAIEDIENKLIRYMAADGTYSLINKNGGITEDHDYYQKSFYKTVFDEIWNQLRKLGIAKEPLRSIENKNIFKYSPFVSLTTEQYETMNHLLDDVASSLSSPSAKSIVVTGGAGTGKTVLAFALANRLAVLTNKGKAEDPTGLLDSQKAIASFPTKLKVALVEPVPDFRKIAQEVFREVADLKGIPVVAPSDVIGQDYDILIVDEAHRLKRGYKLTNYKSHYNNNKVLGLPEKATELDWIQKSAKYAAIYFYDPMQMVRCSDVRPFDFQALISKAGKSIYDITNQVRLEAGKDYIDYWKHILRNEPLGDKPDIGTYDFRIYDNVREMTDDIIKQDNRFSTGHGGGLCRTMMGFDFKWSHKMRDKGTATKTYPEINLHGEKYYWNSDPATWLTNAAQRDEIGSVYACQGCDLNYAGVIFGPDISYDKVNKRIVVHPENFFDTNSNDKKDPVSTMDNIINAYLVLLTRGIHGTYIYAYDEDLREYLHSCFKVSKQGQQF